MTVNLAGPPDREWLVAEIFYGDEQWAEVNHEKRKLRVEIYPRRDGLPWSFSFDEAAAALATAKARLSGAWALLERTA